MLDHQNLHAEIEVDGGIDIRTILMAHRAGATVFVAGTSIFKSPLGITRAMEQLSISLTS
jgi:ribulose-phosphate 3-epimerase